jgi:hypothetical protein
MKAKGRSGNQMETHSFGPSTRADVLTEVFRALSRQLEATRERLEERSEGGICDA